MAYFIYIYIYIYVRKRYVLFKKIGQDKGIQDLGDRNVGQTED